MCWSGEASAVLASVGLATTVYAAYKKEDPRLWLALGYFSLMELLQAFTYSVIDQCSLTSNQVATMFGYLHIAFQPFFINAISMYFIPQEIKRKIETPIYIMCFISAIVMILQIYPFPNLGMCPVDYAYCSDKLCSTRGDWHIAWGVPANGMMNFLALSPWTSMLPMYPSYFIVGFILPLLYGSWRFTLYHFLIGPALASMTTTNLDEIPAIWCLLSIGILLIVVKTPVRRFMFVRKWILWPRPFWIWA